MVNVVLFNSLKINKTPALGQSQPKAMACLNNKTSTILSGFSISSTLSFLPDNQTASLLLLTVILYFTSRFCNTTSMYFSSSAVLLSLVSLGNCISKSGFILTPKLSYAWRNSSLFAKACSNKISSSERPCCTMVSNAGFRIMPSFIISSAITSWRSTKVL